MPNFPSMLAVDLNGFVQANGVGSVYATDDLGATTPLTVTDLDGVPFTDNEIVASGSGVLPGFIVAGHSVVSWVSGSFRMDIPSLDIIPAGGTTGQVLAKLTDVDYAFTWIDPPTGGGTITEADVDPIVGALVDSGTGDAVNALDLRYKKLGTVAVIDLPAGSVMYVLKGTSWGARPTDRGDILNLWLGASPGPTIVSSGTGGARNGLDLWIEPQP